MSGATRKLKRSDMLKRKNDAAWTVGFNAGWNKGLTWAFQQASKVWPMPIEGTTEPCRQCGVGIVWEYDQERIGIWPWEMVAPENGDGPSRRVPHAGGCKDVSNPQLKTKKEKANESTRTEQGR